MGLLIHLQNHGTDQGYNYPYPNQQEEIWKRKYSNVASDMTYEQFQWAMEVVHSRAFCGEFGIKGGVSSALFMSPLISGLLGYIYYVQLHGQNDF